MWAVRKLTPKQERFIEAYTSSLNASASARAAGYAARRSDVAGSRLLANPAIKRVLAARKARQVERADVSAERVLLELKRLAYANPAMLFDSEGHLKAPHTWTAEEAACVAGFDVVKSASRGDGLVDLILRIRFWDKTKSLEMLARHLNLLVERIEHRGEITIQWLPADATSQSEVPAVEVKRLIGQSDREDEEVGS